MMTFTSPGKMGDTLHQWPVAFWWHRLTGQPFDLWLDAQTATPLKPLFEAQPGVHEVRLMPGIINYN